MQRHLPCLAATLLLGCLSTPSLAAPPTTLVGTFSGEYGKTDSDAGDADSWGFNAAGAFGLGLMDIGAQINGGFHRISVDNVSSDTNVWDIGGSLFFAPAAGRFGATVSYTSLDFGGGIDAHATTYGVFGELFLSPMFTIGAKGGGVSGDASVAGFGSASDTGTYLGGTLTGYVMPNLAVNGNIDYVDFSGVQATSYGVAAEYLFSEMTPISVFAGYTRTEISDGGGDADTWHIGLKFYTGGPAPLVTQHRTGTLGSIGTVSATQFAF